MAWTIEYRPELPTNGRYELTEGLAHRGRYRSVEAALRWLPPDVKVMCLNCFDPRILNTNQGA
jgi:hypothetical protein